MAYETLMNTTIYTTTPVCQKKTYTPAKAMKKIFKVACKIFKASGHQQLKNHSMPKELPLPTSEEELQNSQNEQLEAELVQLWSRKMGNPKKNTTFQSALKTPTESVSKHHPQQL